MYNSLSYEISFNAKDLVLRLVSKKINKINLAHADHLLNWTQVRAGKKIKNSTT